MGSSCATVSVPLSLVIADSNQMQSQLLGAALRRRPEFEVTCCATETEAILAALSAHPGCVLVINPGPGLDRDTELANVRRIHLAHPQVGKILLHESWDRELVVGAFRSGVRGLVCFSETSFRLFCRCITAVAEGQVWASSRQLQYLLDEVTQVPSLRVFNQRGDTLLTPREEQVVALVAEGLSNRGVARELSLSEHTVKKYMFRIFDKLGISSRVELVLYAVNHGDARNAEWVAGSSPGRLPAGE